MKIRRILTVIWFILTIGVIAISAYALVNTYVSYKYEVSEALIQPSLTEQLLIKKRLLGDTIDSLWYLLGYFILNLGIGAFLIFSKNKPAQKGRAA